MNEISRSMQNAGLAKTDTNRQLTSHHYEMGTLLGHNVPFELNEEHLSTHSCVLGSSGSGKSKFLELLMRYLMVSNRGFALLDPHGDLSEDVLAFAAYRKASKKDASIQDRIHYLEPSFEKTFSLDPFRIQSTKKIPEEFKKNYYSAVLHAKADRVAEIFQRKQNQANFEGMPRLQRVLTDVLVATGTQINESGQHLPLADAMALLDCTDLIKHKQLIDRLRPYLEPEIVADFDRIAGFKNEDQRLRETESTINRLRSLFSPIVKAIFARQAVSIDFRSILQKGEILLINLRESEYFSADQRRALGGLFIHEILTTAQNEERADRKPFHFIIDEAADFIGDDLQTALGVMRKFKLSICLAAQDLSSFKKGELDLRPKVLSQCGTKISFNQTWHEDLDVLARVLATGNLSFEKHFQIVDRPDGYDWVKVVEESEGESVGKNTGNSVTRQSSTAISHGENNSTSTANSSSVTNSQNKSEGRNRSDAGNGESRHTDSESRGSGVATTEGRTVTEGCGASFNRTETEGKGETSSTGDSITNSKSKSYKSIPLARQREERHETPSLKNAITDQLEYIKQTLHSLGTGEAMVKLRNEQAALLIKTAHVKEYWDKDKFQAITRMKELCQQKPYFSVPDFSPAASEARRQEFLAAGQKTAESLTTNKSQTEHGFIT